MPDAYTGDVRIHYRVEGDGTPFVLQHGFSDSLESWYEYGYVDALSPDFRLILIDARGHGASDKPHDPSAYGLVDQASDVVNVMDDVAVEKAHYYGYSMGGNIGLVLAKRWPARFTSIVIGGASPIKGPTDDDDDKQFGEQLQKGAVAFAEIWESQATISPALKSRILSNDMDALNAAWRNEDSTPLEDALLTFPSPYLLILGEKDPSYPTAIEYSTRLPEGSLFTLPGLNHLEAFQRSDLVLPHLAEFLARVAQ